MGGKLRGRDFLSIEKGGEGEREGMMVMENFRCGRCSVQRWE